MKLLLDTGLPRSAAALLRGQGMGVVHTGEIGHSTSSDEAILQFARKEGRVVVTLDADFHALMALANANSPSVIRIRYEGLRAEALSILLTNILKQISQDLEAGALVTLYPGRTKIRNLPLVR